MTRARRVIVVGAGWAGLAASVRLARDGRKVVLVDAAHRAGGRARSIELHGRTVDNGQHIGIGAYTAVMELGGMLGIDASALFHRMPLTLVQRDRGGVRFALRVPRLPRPLDLAVSFACVRGLGWRERLALATGIRRLRRAPVTDCSVNAFLAEHGQPRRLCTLLWNPLCTAALNTPPAIASARLFANVLDACFAPARGASDILLPSRDLGALLPEPAVVHVEGNGGETMFGTRVSGIVVEDGGVRGVTAGDNFHEAGHVVLAVPPDAAARLLDPHLPDTAAQARRFAYQPIATVYLRYDAGVRLDPAIQGFVGTTVQWVIDRRIAGTDGVMAAVVSAGGEHEQLSTAALGERIASELAACFPAWPAPSSTSVVREKRATFSAVAGVDAYRPASGTRVRGLWLAGDWTATGLPSTLEGAVRSGFECARRVAAS